MRKVCHVSQSGRVGRAGLDAPGMCPGRANCRFSQTQVPQQPVVRRKRAAGALRPAVGGAGPSPPQNDREPGVAGAGQSLFIWPAGHGPAPL
eukprot:gene7752-biopygen37